MSFTEFWTTPNRPALWTRRRRSITSIMAKNLRIEERIWQCSTSTARDETNREMFSSAMLESEKVTPLPNSSASFSSHYDSIGKSDEVKHPVELHRSRRKMGHSMHASLMNRSVPTWFRCVRTSISKLELDKRSPQGTTHDTQSRKRTMPLNSRVVACSIGRQSF